MHWNRKTPTYPKTPRNCPREYDWLLDRMVDIDIDYWIEEKREEENEED